MSILETLTKSTNNKDSLLFRINSMADREFMIELNTDDTRGDMIRNAIHTASIREKAYRYYLASGRLNTSSKEITILGKTANVIKLTDYLNCMDDESFKTVAVSAVFRDVIDRNIALSARYETIRN